MAKLTTEQKLAILHSERGIQRIHQYFNDRKYSSGFELHDFTKKESIDFPRILIGDILDLDIDELYNCDIVSSNCQILYEDLKNLGFNWWHLVDALNDVIFQFCDGDLEINEYNLRCVENGIKQMYYNYTLKVRLELPPEIPQEAKNG